MEWLSEYVRTEEKEVKLDEIFSLSSEKGLLCKTCCEAKVTGEFSEGKLVMIRTANKATAAYINRQGGVRSAQLLSLARQLLCWAHPHLLFIRAAYIPGVLNRGADIMSRGGPQPGDSAP